MSVFEIKKINYLRLYGGANLSHDEAYRWKITQVSDDKWMLLTSWSLESLSDHEQVFELLWDLGSSSENVDNILCLPQGYCVDEHWDKT